jgi:hypothetical protein
MTIVPLCGVSELMKPAEAILSKLVKYASFDNCNKTEVQFIVGAF